MLSTTVARALVDYLKHTALTLPLTLQMMQNLAAQHPIFVQKLCLQQKSLTLKKC